MAGFYQQPNDTQVTQDLGRMFASKNREAEHQEDMYEEEVLETDADEFWFFIRNLNRAVYPLHKSQKQGFESEQIQVYTQLAKEMLSDASVEQSWKDVMKWIKGVKNENQVFDILKGHNLIQNVNSLNLYQQGHRFAADIAVRAKALEEDFAKYKGEPSFNKRYSNLALYKRKSAKQRSKAVEDYARQVDTPSNLNERFTTLEAATEAAKKQKKAWNPFKKSKKLKDTIGAPIITREGIQEAGLLSNFDSAHKARHATPAQDSATQDPADRSSGRSSGGNGGPKTSKSLFARGGGAHWPKSNSEVAMADSKKGPRVLEEHIDLPRTPLKVNPSVGAMWVFDANGNRVPAQARRNPVEQPAEVPESKRYRDYRAREAEGKMKEAKAALLESPKRETQDSSEPFYLESVLAEISLNEVRGKDPTVVGNDDKSPVQGSKPFSWVSEMSLSVPGKAKDQEDPMKTSNPAIRPKTPSQPDPEILRLRKLTEDKLASTDWQLSQRPKEGEKASDVPPHIRDARDLRTQLGAATSEEREAHRRKKAADQSRLGVGALRPHDANNMAMPAPPPDHIQRGFPGFSPPPPTPTIPSIPLVYTGVHHRAHATGAGPPRTPTPAAAASLVPTPPWGANGMDIRAFKGQAAHKGHEAKAHDYPPELWENIRVRDEKSFTLRKDTDSEQRNEDREQRRKQGDRLNYKGDRLNYMEDQQQQRRMMQDGQTTLDSQSRNPNSVYGQRHEMVAGTRVERNEPRQNDDIVGHIRQHMMPQGREFLNSEYQDPDAVSGRRTEIVAGAGMQVENNEETEEQLVEKLRQSSLERDRATYQEDCFMRPKTPHKRDY